MFAPLKNTTQRHMDDNIAWRSSRLSFLAVEHAAEQRECAVLRYAIASAFGAVPLDLCDEAIDFARFFGGSVLDPDSSAVTGFAQFTHLSDCVALS